MDILRLTIENLEHQRNVLLQELIHCSTELEKVWARVGQINPNRYVESARGVMDAIAVEEKANAPQ